MIEAQRPALPLTVIGGYLGVGKTTLINRVLARSTGQRLAVLVNDFGELNIDATLIAGAEGDTIALTNGCVCCAIGDDLGAALAQLQARRDRLDAVLLEASGVADPLRLGRMADTWPGFRLASVTVVADALRIRDLCRDQYVGAHVRAQIVTADQILVSKLDRSSPIEQRDVLEWLHAQTSASIVTDDRKVLAVDAHRRPPPPGLRATHPTFQTRTFRANGPVDRERLEHWAENLDRSIRAKGFAQLTATMEWYTVQLVAGSLQFDRLSATQQKPEVTQLVLIGPDAAFLEPPL